MSKKVLFVATVDKGHIIKFHIPYLKYFKDKGYEVHVACSGDEEIPYCDIKHELPFERSPYKISNLIVYKKLKKIINSNSFRLIHCHTPMGGVIGRLASKEARKKGTKVIYTAHGFHFYNGASILNWLLYYPIEKWLSRETDCLITINDEDYTNSFKNGFKASKIKLVHGVGVDLKKFSPASVEEKKKLRDQYGYNETDFILLYTAELNKNKNQLFLIDIINHLKTSIPNIKLLLAGDGTMQEEYEETVKKLELHKYIEFLGFRSDINSLLKLSDVSVTSSKREGLPVNIMEAMATGIPVIATDCRGNRDLVKSNLNGFLVDQGDTHDFINCIIKLKESEILREKLGNEATKFIQKYSLENVQIEMDGIYSDYF